MNDTIQMLERIGQRADLRYADATALQDAIAAAAIDVNAGTAICNGDRAMLEELLHARQKLCCMVYPVETPAN